jgi:membrane-bound lytic murein transglycosylase B
MELQPVPGPIRATGDVMRCDLLPPAARRACRRIPRPTASAALLLPCLLAGTAAAAAPPSATPPSYDMGGTDFVADMVREHGFERDALAALMADARYQQRIIDAMNRPYEAKPWRAYRALFITPERIAGGVAFRRDNDALLRRAEAAYGVPPEIITAIVGVETNYGRHLGDHRVLDALSTLGFSYPKRAAFFRGELEEFLLLARDEQVDPRAVKGSYAGAVGKPQFIPSSYRAYAVDFDADGRRDLWGSDADVIGSVGNYLAQNGWRRGEPVAAPVVLSAGPPAGIEIATKRPVRPELTVQRLADAGVQAAADAPGAPETTRAVLIELDGDGPEYWLGFDNFYAITRYNNSNLYAMAVYQLSREIARRQGGEGG